MAAAAKIERTTAKARFTRSETSLAKALTSDGIPVETMTRRFKDFKAAYIAAESAHDTYAIALGENTDEDDDALGAWIDDIISRFEKMEVDYDQKVKLISTPVQPIAAADANLTITENPRLVGAEKDVFQHDKIKLPPFDGNIRKYAKWREEFETHIKPLCKPTQLAFILKSHLCEELREEMDVLGGDAEEIWGRLDQRYGNKGRLVDTILAEVKSIQVCNDDESTLIMIKIIERCYSELKFMKREAEMNNTTIISMIEEKMSLEMSTEWIKIITKKDANHTDKFTMLKDLLDEWRGRIEYRMANVRATTNIQQSNTFYGTASNFNTRARQPSCWIHTNNGDHPIWRCRAFANKSVNERIQLALEHRACFKCLEKGHNTNSCTKSFKCTVPNCNQHHNKLLHKDGDTIPQSNRNNVQGQSVQQIQQQIEQLQRQQRQLQQQQQHNTPTGDGILLPGQ